ncbi:MAG TPA: hypothetical protein VKG23_01275 [Thermoanaerobaculia bacterium]|nr:hypothetical protein [Thermoanaerobaculia bacterium]
MKQGEHVTTIGPTGSGKTVLNRELLKLRDFVLVLGVKNRDPELYGGFEREGYRQVNKFDPTPADDATEERVLYVPKTSKHGAEGRKERAGKLRHALNDVYDAGAWAVYVDDVQYVSDQLGLSTELEELWMLGRSEGVTVVASSQEPVNIPLMAYGQATHLFLFQNPDLRRADRMAELTGVNREIVRETILRLPPHEFLYANKATQDLVRSKVERTPRLAPSPTPSGAPSAR